MFRVTLELFMTCLIFNEHILFSIDNKQQYLIKIHLKYIRLFVKSERNFAKASGGLYN